MLSEQESQLICRIYDAALDSSLWAEVLQSIVDITHSNTAIFTACDQLNPGHDFVFSHQIPQEGLIAYQDERVKVVDMKLHRSLWQQAGVGDVVKQDLSHYGSMPKHSDEFLFYDKCMRVTDIAYVGAVLLEEGKHRWSVLGVHRHPRSQIYNAKELQVLSRLGKHLRRALQIHRQLSAVKQENRELYQLLDCLGTGVIILDQERRICYSNPEAARILEHSSLLYPDSHNCLQTSSRFQPALNHAIDSALLQPVTAERDEQGGGVIGLYDEGTQDKPLMLTVVPLSRYPQFDAWKTQHHVAVFMTEHSKRQQLAKSFMQDTYGLSERQFQLCELFLNGMDFEEIAEHLEISLQSVRTYFKSIFAKTHCDGQVSLLRLLMGLTQNFEHIV